MAKRTKAKVSVLDIDRGWKDIVKTVKKLANQSVSVRVGYLGGRAAETHPDEEGGEALTNAQLGLIHEFGVPGRTPERSHLRHTFDKYRTTYEQIVTKLFWKAISQEITVAKALAIVGMKHAFDIKNEIRNAQIKQDLSPLTLAAKWEKSATAAYAKRDARAAKAKRPKEGPLLLGTPKALIDTGRLLNSISYVVDSSGRGGDGG